MRKAEEVLNGTEELDRNFFLRLKDKQCGANPFIAAFVSEEVLKNIIDKETQTRLLQVTLFALEMLGAGDKENIDYVKVSRESIESAKNQEIIFDIEEIHAIKPKFGNAIFEARFYVENLNRTFNDFYGTKIPLEELLQRMDIFLKAYWIEIQKQKTICK
ncbi:MAG: hypothetical protein KAI67_03825 [Candidatus Pacebacteria bacterium]|nr:hypothetical protein [Candidatus Paceibacterota bacterium]